MSQAAANLIIGLSKLITTAIMNTQSTEPKLKRPEDVDVIYAALQREKLYLWSVLNEIRPYLLKGDIDLHYGGVIQTEEAFNNHIFDFLWLILCIEG